MHRLRLQEKTQAAVQEVPQNKATAQLNGLNSVPRTMAEQQSLLDQLEQKCRDSGRADQDKLVLPTAIEQTGGSPAVRPTHQQVRKRKARGHEESSARVSRNGGDVENKVAQYGDARDAQGRTPPSLKRRRETRGSATTTFQQGSNASDQLSGLADVERRLKLIEDRLK